MQQDSAKAVKLGTICISSYFACYVTRNILGILTPTMLEAGFFTTELAALLSSVYFAFYAVGQLINGIVGDIIKPRLMILSGLVLSGFSMILFPFVGFAVIQVLFFAMVGFGCSMLRGPLVKVISENTLPKYARICCMFLSYVAYASPLLVSLLAALFPWRAVFVICGAFSTIMGIVSFLLLSLCERQGLITLRQGSWKQVSIGGILQVFRLDGFLTYTFFGMLTEIGAASISFWIPTYISQHLNFSPNTANLIYSGLSLVRSACPFLGLVLYSAFRQRDNIMMRTLFFIAALLFAGMLAAPYRWINIGMLTLALLCSSSASAVIWTVYIPGLGKSGRVSSANGVMDCCGYAAAALANMLSAQMMRLFSWNGLILLWSVLMLSGAVVALLHKHPILKVENA